MKGGLCYCKVLVKIDLDIFFPGAVDGNVIVLFEGADEMGGIILCSVLDTTVINNKGELDRTGVMFP